MKKILSIIMLSSILMAGCSTAELTGSEIIDTRYTAGHSEVVTEYEYKYDALNVGFVYVPNTHTVWIDDKYEICVRYTFDDGSIEEQWEECSKEAYLENGGVT